MSNDGPSASGHRKLLGVILQEMDLVMESEIQEALEIQRREGGLLGEILVRLIYTAPEEIAVALTLQSRFDGEERR